MYQYGVMILKENYIQPSNAHRYIARLISMVDVEF